MKSNICNEVVIIGADHHNTLAAIRCFGKCKCRLKVLVHTNEKDAEKVCVAHSRYAKGNTVCVSEDPQSILEWLLINVADKKQILFPCTDLAEFVIDDNYTLLSNNYILPGFKDKPGMVVRLMDKWKQSKFASEHGLPMAKTWELNCAAGFQVPEDMVYPCIVKPEISAFGRKGDIVICDTETQLVNALEKMENAKYDVLVVQQFLCKQYEVCAYGCIVNDKNLCAGGTIRKMREFPPRGGGSLTFARFIDVESVNAIRDRVLDLLYELGYRGQYDIEFLVCDEGVYLNEINFRHSGNGYGLVQNGVYAPYIWAADAIGIKLSTKTKISVKTGKYHMDELSDFFHLKANNVTYFTWMRDCLKTSAFSKWDISDPKAAFVYYKPTIKAIVKKLLFIKR